MLLPNVRFLFCTPMLLLVHLTVVGKAFSAFDKDRGGTISNDEIGKRRTQFGHHAAAVAGLSTHPRHSRLYNITSRYK